MLWERHTNRYNQTTWLSSYISALPVHWAGQGLDVPEFLRTKLGLNWDDWTHDLRESMIGAKDARLKVSQHLFQQPHQVSEKSACYPLKNIISYWKSYWKKWTTLLCNTFPLNWYFDWSVCFNFICYLYILSLFVIFIFFTFLLCKKNFRLRITLSWGHLNFAILCAMPIKRILFYSICRPSKKSS